MDNGSLKRKKLKFTDINILSQDLNESYNRVINAELGFWYSMDVTLKKYAKLPPNYKIHALLEHGVMLTEFTEGSFRAHEYLPSIVSSKYRVNILKREKTFNGAYAIGPYIHYAESLLTDEQFKIEKERLGRSLLVFPSHSTDALLSKFDYNNFCKDIQEYSDDFNSIRICMYYKDIQENKHKIYQKNGFEVVTAGHPYDNYFMSRLKSIIELSDMTISNDIGSHLGYCIYLNKPHFINSEYKTSYSSNSENQNIQRESKKSKEYIDKSENIKNIYNLFSNFDKKINKKQFDLISYLWGFDEIKGRDELKNLFMQINQNFSWFKYYLNGLTRLKNVKIHNAI